MPSRKPSKLPPKEPFRSGRGACGHGVVFHVETSSAALGSSDIATTFQGADASPFSEKDFLGSETLVSTVSAIEDADVILMVGTFTQRMSIDRGAHLQAFPRRERTHCHRLPQRLGLPTKAHL